MGFNVQGQGVARGRGRSLDGNSRFTLEVLACKEVRSGAKPPFFIAEFSVVSADVNRGASGKEVLPYRPGELVSIVIGVPPFPGGEKAQAEEINAFLYAVVGGDADAFLARAGEVCDAAISSANVLEGRVVECATLEKEMKTKPGQFFTYRNFSPHTYAEGEAPAGLDALLAGTKKPAAPAKPAQRPAAPAFPPPPPPTHTSADPPEPWAGLPASYQRPPSAKAPRGEYWNGSAWLAK